MSRKPAARGAQKCAYAIAIDPYGRDTFEIGKPPHGLAFDFERIFAA